MKDSVDHPLARIKYIQRLMLRRLRRHGLAATREHKILWEQLQIDGAEVEISMAIINIRKAFRNLRKVEKKLIEREREKPQNKLAGQNRGGAPSPLRR